jgi:hypothetical protein
MIDLTDHDLGAELEYGLEFDKGDPQGLIENVLVANVNPCNSSMDLTKQSDNNLALNLNLSQETDTRGVPQSSINDATGNETKNIEISSNGILATDQPWSPARMHSRRNRGYTLGRRMQKPRKVFHQIETMNIFNNIKEEEFVLLEPTSNSGLPQNDEKLYQEMRKVCKTQRENITKLRNGTLLIKTENKKESDDLKKLKNLMKCDIEVKSHPTLNQTKATIYAPDLLHLSPDELAEDWKIQGQKVMTVYRFQKREGEVMKPSPGLLITFEGLNFPETIWHGFRIYNTRIYIPNPMRCFRCNKLGHSGKYCRSIYDTCVRCGEEKHSLPCLNTPKCINCNGEHPANSSNCIQYKISKETIAIKTKERCSFRDARSRAELQFNNIPFADVLKVSRTTQPPQALIRNTAEAPTSLLAPSYLINQAKPSNKRHISKENSTDEENVQINKVQKSYSSHGLRKSPPSKKILITTEAEVHQSRSLQTSTLCMHPGMVKPLPSLNSEVTRNDKMDSIEMELSVLDSVNETNLSSSAKDNKLPLLPRRQSLINDYPMPPTVVFTTPTAKTQKDSLRPKSKKQQLLDKKFEEASVERNADYFKKPSLLTDLKSANNGRQGRPLDPRKQQIKTIITKGK